MQAGTRGYTAITEAERSLQAPAADNIIIGDMSDVDVVSYSSGSRRESTSAIELRRHRQLQGSSSNYICRLWHASAWKIPRARNSDFRASFWRLSTDQAALAVRANIGIGRQTGHTKRTRIPGGYKLVGRLKHISVPWRHTSTSSSICACGFNASDGRAVSAMLVMSAGARQRPGK